MLHPISKPGTVTPLMCSQFGRLATSGLARIGWILPDIAQKHTWIADYLTDTGHEVEKFRFLKILSL